MYHHHGDMYYCFKTVNGMEACATETIICSTVPSLYKYGFKTVNGMEACATGKRFITKVVLLDGTESFKTVNGMEACATLRVMSQLVMSQQIQSQFQNRKRYGGMRDIEKFDDAARAYNRGEFQNRKRYGGMRDS